MNIIFKFKYLLLLLAVSIISLILFNLRYIKNTHLPKENFVSLYIDAAAENPMYPLCLFLTENFCEERIQIYSSSASGMIFKTVDNSNMCKK